MSTATSTGSGRLNSKGPYLYITQCYRGVLLAIVFFVYLPYFFMFKHSIVIYSPWDDIEKKERYYLCKLEYFAYICKRFSAKMIGFRCEKP